MKKKLIYVLLFVFGVSGGVFFNLSRVRATTPVGETSGGETVPSVVYDEHWKADSAIISDSVGASSNIQWVAFNGFVNFPPTPTPASRKPKMVVTRWIVHGHVHMR